MSQNLPQHVAVFGALRSGTTLLRLMLDEHDRLACPGETDYMFDHVSGGVPGDPVFDVEAMADNRIYRVFCDQFGLDPSAPQTMHGMMETMQGPKAAQDATVVLMLHRSLETALTHLPDMKILHLIRDPRDVARSSIGMGWAGSTYYGVRHWLDTEREWSACAPRLAPEQVLEVTYEALIEAPEETLGRICDFFGVSYTSSMLEYDGSSTYSKPDPSLTYQWRRKQTPREIGLVEAQLGELLITRGYPQSDHPPVVPGPLERLRLAIGQRRATWSVQIQRFGLRDPVLDKLSRHLGWPALGQPARRRMDAAMERYVK
ncbi:sulfotransferase family protein [Primorskyibacter flagellatus]|uniref:Sulfotransferase family protein n=1 Tax=Primorskyibacter flagellatus TaxID=1387277 RepID=A0A1W2E282_9RHOB|nr:sulfotransferase [Primorskyibacter flagellatus]SMD03168.1 Sulfotransferase family protein [Primorskyibacter flagellatus]